MAITILVLLIGVGMSTLVTSNNLFIENASHAQCKQIGDAVLDFVANEIRYAGSVTIDGTMGGALVDGQERLYISADGSLISEAGKLYYGNADGDIDFYGDDFYAGTTLKLFIQGGSNTPTIRVTLLREDETVAYQNEQTLQLPNCSVSGTSTDGFPTVITYTQPIIG